MKIYILLAVVIISTAYANPLIGKADDDIDYRLNESTIPVHYDLTITPYLETPNEFGKDQFTFDGKVVIKILAGENKNTLRIHKKNIDISKQSITAEDDSKTIEITKFEYVEEAEIYVLTFSEDLVQGSSYILTFEYTGTMDKDMHGFYRSSYVEDGETVWMGSTQMQQTHARRVFPGFDEPKYKATFILTVNKPKTYSVYSNTNLDTSEPSEIEGVTTYDRAVFKKTPKMSSYLLVFIVSTFTRYTVTSTPAGNDFGILSRKSQQAHSEYAYTFGKDALEELGNYMGYSYYSMKDGDGNNLEKLDMAAIPDFSAGAMENYGLLTYRETNQLYDKDYTSDLTRQRIAAVIIHEQAHLWFGDLVTCAWWGDTWLNEGFARFFQYHGTAISEPLWGLNEQFVVEQVQTAMLFDSSESTHPMSHEVNTPAEASAIFNNISYNKGAAILRMIEHLVGNTKFVEAIRNYINKNEYKATVPQDLFDEFLAVAGTDYPNIVDIMKSWTTQSNYPVIKVTYDATTKKATVTQKVFLLKADATNKKTWLVPLTFTTRGKGFTKVKPTSILSTSSATIPIDTDGWIIFNLQQSGFYRVNYDDNNWKLIKDALLSENHDGIHEVNRAQIIDDLFNFARSGELTFEFVYEMFDYLKTEEHYIPWLSAFTTFNFVISKMNAEQLVKFRGYLISLLENSYKSVGFTQNEEDDQLTIYHRSNVINWLCKLGHSECISEAKKIFDTYKSNTKTLVPINIRAAVYCSAMRQGSVEDLNFLWTQYVNKDIPTEQLTILTAVGCASKKDVLIKVIGHILSPAVRDQDRRSALTNAYTQTEENLQIVLDYVIENPDKVQEGFDGDKGAVVTTLTSLAGRFTNEAQVEQLLKFAEDTVEYAEFKTRLTNAVNSAKVQIEWNNANIVKLIAQIDVNTGNTPDPDDDAGLTHTASVVVVIALSLAAYLLNF